jgi:hypothetical protein
LSAPFPSLPRQSRRAGLSRAAALLAVLAALALSGCIDPIELNVGAPERRLVVEGLVTEGDGPHEVRLRRSGAFTQGADAIRLPVPNAVVRITSDEGASVTLTETGGGQYVAPVGALYGRPGVTYTLHIRLPDGTIYTSEPETMRRAADIAEISAELVQANEVIGGVLVQQPRIVLLVDGQPVQDETMYPRWSWRGVYHTFNCQGMVCRSCYIPARGVSNIQLAEVPLAPGTAAVRQTAALFPLPAEGEKFVHNFYIEVEQQALTPEAFNFWSRIRQTRDQVGSLFDPPPDAIIGNVAQEDDRTEYALGYFTVAATTRQSTCLRLTDFPERPSHQYDGAFSGACPGFPSPPPEFQQSCER